MALTYSLDAEIGKAVEAHIAETSHAAKLDTFWDTKCECGWKAHSHGIGNPFGVDEFGGFMTCTDAPGDLCPLGDPDFYDKHDVAVANLRREYFQPAAVQE